MPAEPPATASAPAANAAGAAFAQRWIEASREDQIQELATTRPRIQRKLDIQLLVHAEQSLGSLRERQDLKYALPEGFWATLDASAARLRQPD